jgi:hypothetical protein
VPEQLALEQRLGDGAAVHRDERTRRARRLVVHEPGDALLARAALTGDEHGRVDLRHPAREVDDWRIGALFATMPSGS